MSNEQRTVERFEPYVDYSVEDNGEPDMRPAKDGDWRRNEDYERLEKQAIQNCSDLARNHVEDEQRLKGEIAKLQHENKALREALTNFYTVIRDRHFGRMPEAVQAAFDAAGAALAAHGSET